MRIKLILTSLITLLFCSPFVYAGQNVDQPQHKGMIKENMDENAPTTVEVGNKICPVTGAKIGSMGPAVQYEYKGKIYNFCCQGCIQDFQKDPEKYILKVQAELENMSQ